MKGYDGVLIKGKTGKEMVYRVKTKFVEKIPGMKVAGNKMDISKGLEEDDFQDFDDNSYKDDLKRLNRLRLANRQNKNNPKVRKFKL